MKKLLILLALFIILPVSASQFEDALAKGKPTFVYLYTKECKYCNEFQPTYEKLLKQYQNKMVFCKIDANSKEGLEVARSMGAMFVPYITLLNSSKKIANRVPIPCLEDYACVNSVVNEFIRR